MAYSVLMERLLRRTTGFLVILACVLASALTPNGVQADTRTDFLMRMLATSSQFRVRAQAALALGQQAAEPGIVTALVTGLRDEHPAVRAASAAALERLKAASAVPALKAAQNDGDGAVRTAVRSALQALGSGGQPEEPAARTASSTPNEPAGTGNATFYVGVGVPGSQVGLSKEALRSLRENLAQQVAQISGVLLAPENEPNKAAERVISAQKLVGYYLDSSITSIDLKPDGSVRAAVSVVVNTYPGRDIRVMLSGAATLSGGGSGEDAKVQAIQAAYQGALRRLPQAMQAGLASAP